MHRIKMEVLTMLKRKIEKDIMHWIEGSNQALLVYGVRQAGKTFIIRKCLKAAGCDFIEFNLIRQPELVDILAGSTGIDDLILKSPAAMKVAFGENPKVNYSGQNKSPVTRMAIAAMLRRELWESREYLRQKQEAAEKGE